MFLVIGVSLPYAPLWLASLGLDGWMIGLIVGVQPALRWGSALVVAAVADRRRIRHGLVVACGAGGALFYLLLPGVADAWVLLGLFVAISVFHGPLIPLVDAVALDHLDDLGGDYGRLRVSGSIAFVVGAVVAGALVARWSPGVVPWLLLVTQAGVVPALWTLPRGQAGHAEERHGTRRLLTPPLRAFLAMAFLVQASAGAFNGFFALHVRALGLPETLPGITFGLAVVAESALFLRGRPLLERWTPPALLHFVLWVTVLRWLLSAVVASAVLVVVVQLAHAVTFSVFHLASQRLLAPLVPPADRTSGQGLYGFMAFGLGSTAGIWLAGALVDHVGTSALFLLEAAVALAAVWPARLLARRTAGVRWQAA